MTSEKVKYFSSTEVISYVAAFLFIGVFIGNAFGRPV